MNRCCNRQGDGGLFVSFVETGAGLTPRLRDVLRRTAGRRAIASLILAALVAFGVVALSVMSARAGDDQGSTIDDRAGTNETPTLNANLDPVFDMRNGRPLQVVLADTKLSVPTNYFDRAAIPRSTKQDGMLLHAFMPGMEPIRDDTMEEFRTTRGQGRRAQILVEDARSTTDLQFRLEAQLKLAAPLTTSSHYGLSAYQSITGSAPRAFRMEILADRNHDNTDGVIVCDIDGRVPFPSCSHEFVDGNFIVHVTYGKSYLSQWRVVKELTTKLLAAFSAAPHA